VVDTAEDRFATNFPDVVSVTVYLQPRNDKKWRHIFSPTHVDYDRFFLRPFQHNIQLKKSIMLQTCCILSST